MRWPHAYFSGPQKLSKVQPDADAVKDAYHRVPLEFLGTITGRFAKSEPEIQELGRERPSSKELIECDFSEVEKRILGHMEDKK